MKHFIDLNDVTLKEIEDLFTLAAKLKRELKAGIEHHLLRGKVLGMILQSHPPGQGFPLKQEYQLGGYPIFLNSGDIQRTWRKPYMTRQRRSHATSTA